MDTRVTSFPTALFVIGECFLFILQSPFYFFLQYITDALVSDEPQVVSARQTNMHSLHDQLWVYTCKATCVVLYLICFSMLENTEFRHFMYTARRNNRLLISKLHLPLRWRTHSHTQRRRIVFAYLDKWLFCSSRVIIHGELLKKTNKKTKDPLCKSIMYTQRL